MYVKPYRPPSGKSPLPLPVTATYLGEDENNYYHLDGFFDGMGNMFKRMVKITPKSFTFKNIYKGVVDGVLTASTFGAYQLLPKKMKKQIHRVGEVAIPVVAAGALAVWAGPSVMSAIGPKLSQAGSFLGKAASTIGGNLFSAMQKLPPAQQQQVAEAVTPQQIVEMEQSGRIPPALMQVLDRASEQAYQYAAQQAQPMPGLAPTVMAMKQEEEAAGVVPIQAGMSGEGAGVAMAGLAIAALWFASQGKR